MRLQWRRGPGAKTESDISVNRPARQLHRRRARHRVAALGAESLRNDSRADRDACSPA